MEFLWPILILISILYGTLTGRLIDMNNGLFKSLDDAISLSLTFLGNICFWNGIMNILKHSSLFYKVSRLIHPIMKIVFPNIKYGTEEYENISINITSNLLGIGNAATPLGLKAMKCLQQKNKNKDRLSDDMFMFILINTASIQLIPTTIMAIRKNLNCKNISIIFIPVWISTFLAAIVGIIVGKIIIQITKKEEKL